MKLRRYKACRVPIFNSFELVDRLIKVKKGLVHVLSILLPTTFDDSHSFTLDYLIIQVLIRLRMVLSLYRIQTILSLGWVENLVRFAVFQRKFYSGKVNVFNNHSWCSSYSDRLVIRIVTWIFSVEQILVNTEIIYRVSVLFTLLVPNLIMHHQLQPISILPIPKQLRILLLYLAHRFILPELFLIIAHAHNFNLFEAIE